jgi:hypothetical protein
LKATTTKFLWIKFQVMSPKQAPRFVAYFRVSTDRQGKSGLGLEAQRASVINYLNGGTWELVGEFVEVESGKHSDRPRLAEALQTCRKHRASWSLPSSTDCPETLPSSPR